MKTLADFKRRLVVGSRLQCLEHSGQARLVGDVRTVTQVGATGYWWESSQTGGSQSHTSFPKANTVTWLDADTVRFTSDGVHAFTLRFLASAGIEPVAPSVPTLSREDWAEIYAALKLRYERIASGEPGVPGSPHDDARTWFLHILRILDTIGKGGAHMTPPEASA